ncbi:hypothetical protein BH23PLA1_BH23PLA1_29170 [soil metagenome]
MAILVLEAFHYPNPPEEPGRPRFGWHSILTRHPEWTDIEAAIRRLDRDEWPLLWLHTEEPPEADFPNNMFCIMGGRGEYELSLDRDGDEIRCLDPTRSDEVIPIWESDQGSSRFLKNLCNDLPLVLEIIRRFAEQEELHPEVAWETW